MYRPEKGTATFSVIGYIIRNDMSKKQIPPSDTVCTSSDQTLFDAKTFLKNAPAEPGVYCMRGAKAQWLYVGKAKNLKSRLSSYFNDTVCAMKTQVLVSKILNIEVIVTTNETEALILEQTLIKKHKPVYNILLRDDKSYPYICLSEHKFPQLLLYRGKRKKQGKTFGPYPGVGAARESLKILQKIFKVRQCDDSYFSNRKRPCLQYQINRCKAPCVGYVSAEEYQEDVIRSEKFLQGKSQQLICEFVEKMDVASAAMEYEQAAIYRDQIQDLQKLQISQVVNLSKGDIDVIGLATQSGVCCIEILFIRKGSLLGNRHFISTFRLDESSEEILSAFLSQFYISHASRRDFPEEILLNCEVMESDSLQLLISRLSTHKVCITQVINKKQEPYKRWMMMATKNAQQALDTHLISKQTLLQRFSQLKEGLCLSSMPEQIECFDISHTHGEGTVASCVVFDQSGPLSRLYRRFNIKNITPGDDYAALRQAVERRYIIYSDSDSKKSSIKTDEHKLPDILLIDGGIGQINTVTEVLKKLKVNVPVYGVAKGEERKPGMESIIDAATHQVYHFDTNHLGFLLIQQIRDEAHRFALVSHRMRRSKVRKTSFLESIKTIGPKRRTELIKFFGGIQGVKQAEITDIMKVRGISRKLAEEIYKTLHD